MTLFEHYGALFSKKIFILKIGGKLLDNGEFLNRLVDEIGTLANANIRTVLVFGGGTQISDVLKNEKKIDGVRITGADDMRKITPIIEQLGERLEAMFTERGLAAHYERRLCSAASKGEAWQQTGSPAVFDQAVWAKCRENSVTLVGCTVFGASGGERFNVNADEIASFVARQITPEKVIFFSETAMLDENGEVISVLTPKLCDKYRERGVISGGMAAKVQNIFVLLEQGIPRVHLLSADDSVIREIFTLEGSGTLFLPNWSENIRWADGSEYTREYLYRFIEKNGGVYIRPRLPVEIIPSSFSILEFDSSVSAIGEAIPIDRETVELGAFVVDGRMVGHGVGTYFLRRFCEEHHAKGYRRIIAVTKNPRAEYLLLEQGFSGLVRFEKGDVALRQRIGRSPGRKLFFKELAP